jgi:outer membrane protein OmpA-like peptidoglycan-associated protein
MRRWYFGLTFCLGGLFAAASPPRAAETEPVWWFGLTGAANLNLYEGTTQRLNGTFITPEPFHKGFGLGAYIAPTLEYRPDDYSGGMLQIGYDDRRGRFNDIMCPCDETATLSAQPAYLSLEPSLRWHPFGSGRTGGFHMFAGPRVALLWGPLHEVKQFDFRREGSAPVQRDFSVMRGLVYSAQIGVGHDIDLTGLLNSNNLTRLHLAPFASYQPHYGQDPRDTDRDVEWWALSTVRIGAVLKFGRRKPADEAYDVRFSVQAPETVVKSRRIHEVFPLRNYVYFGGDSVGFSGRYTRLTAAGAEVFREEALQTEYPAAPTGRSTRQLAVYRHILNIIGDRLRRNPGATITLVGLSVPEGQGPRLGKARAEEIKRYLVRTFALNETRIAIEERTEPPPPRGRTAEELAMLLAENQRVEILTSSRELLLQVGEGDRFMLKPVEIDGKVPGTDSVAFTLTPASSTLRRVLTRTISGLRDVNGHVSSDTSFVWTLTIRDESGGDSGKVRHFGPYSRARETVPASPLLGDRARARFTAIMTGQKSISENGRSRAVGPILTRQGRFVLSQRHQGIHETLRYGILFDIDQARAVSSYDRFLTTVVAPRITDSATVFIRGRTDVVAPTDYNLTLSKGRAEGVWRLLADKAAVDGKRGVRFNPSWSGEDQTLAPFGNVTPEERNYNRTVIIDVVPQ